MASAVKTWLWIAIYALIAILRKRHRSGTARTARHTMSQILSIMLRDQVLLHDARSECRART
ncbi:MAG: hypothetical protein OXD30_11915 [Bryobacterales bacterium]|nr:hypothetical protein [Bryobacterales bacterium]